MSFTKAVASAVLTLAIAGAAISTADAAKLHKAGTHPGATSRLSNSTISPAGAEGNAGGGAASAGGAAAAGGAGAAGSAGGAAGAAGGMGGGMGR
jgi:hypothetical protein